MILLAECRCILHNIRKAHDAFMIKPLYDAGTINEYCKRVKRDTD